MVYFLWGSAYVTSGKHANVKMKWDIFPVAKTTGRHQPIGEYKDFSSFYKLFILSNWLILQLDSRTIRAFHAHAGGMFPLLLSSVGGVLLEAFSAFVNPFPSVCLD